MASKFYVKEFEAMPVVPGGLAQIWGEPGVLQSVAVDATHREITLGARTHFVCITSDLNVAYVVGASNVVAVSTTDFPLWAYNYIAFAVTPGQTISSVLWA
jgi:predicted ABC-type sugar transport system permease subunit